MEIFHYILEAVQTIYIAALVFRMRKDNKTHNDNIREIRKRIL